MASQKLAFVQTLGEAGDVVSAELLEIIDGALNITYESNPDVKTEWCILGIETGYDAVLEPCRVWMSEQGRNAYVVPTFRALVAAGMCETANRWFAENELFYNSYVVGNVERALSECDDDSQTPGSSGLTGGATAGIVIGVLVFVGAVVSVWYFGTCFLPKMTIVET